MPTPQTYVNLIPPKNRVLPNFSAFVALLTQPFSDLTNLANSIQDLFDVDTAVGQQLDFIGQWVGVRRKISIPISNVFFSTDIAGLGVDQGILLGPYETATGVTVLDDFHYRFLIYGRIAANHWDGSIDDAQSAYLLAFTGQAVSVVINDNNDFTAVVNITGNTTPLQQALITQGYLPLKPINTSITYNFS